MAKIVKINRRTVSVDAPTERALRHVAGNVCAISEFAEGSGRRTRYNTCPLTIPGTRYAHAELIKEGLINCPEKVKQFVRDNPRVRTVIWDDRGAAARIVKKLGS